MNLYEHTIVAKQELSSVDFDKIENKYKDIINNASGKVIKIEKWGLPILILLIFTGVLGKLLQPTINFLLSLVQTFLTI